MTPGRRLATALLATVAGGVVAIVGATTTWYRVTRPGRTIDVPDFGTVPFPEEPVNVSGRDLSVGLLVLGVLVLFAALGALLAGRRARGILLGAAGLAAVGLIVLAVMPDAADALRHAPAGSDVFGDPTATAGLGRWVTLTGAALAAVAAGWGLPVARRVEHLRMPEGAPGD